MGPSCMTSFGGRATSVFTLSPGKKSLASGAWQTLSLQKPRLPPTSFHTSRPCSQCRSALAIGWILRPIFGLETVDLVFLTAVVGVAARYGLFPSLLATVAASLSYNYFFLPPLFTFSIADPTNVAAFMFFAITAVIVSSIAGHGRPQLVSAQERVRSVESLYAFSRKLAAAVSLDDVLWATAYQTALMLKRVRVVLLLPENTTVAVAAGYPPEDTLDAADLAAARWAWTSNRAAGRDSDTLPGAKWLFLPMRTGRGPVGILGITRDNSGSLLTPDQRRLLDALGDQGALAIERVHLVEDIDRVKRAAEADRLRSALLTSISHDLKTPLASVIGSAGALRDLSGSLGDAEKTELLTVIIEESERLNRFIVNLLDMTKLEAGAVVPNATPHDIGEIVGTALQRASKILARHQVEVEISPNCRWSWSTRSCSSRYSSTFWTMLPSTRRRRHSLRSGAGATVGLSCCRFWTKEKVFRKLTLNASSTSFTARRKAIK